MSKKNRSVWTGVLLLLLVLSAVFYRSRQADSSKFQEYENSFLSFDTVITLKIYAPEGNSQLLTHCQEMCTQYENIFSRTLETSELYKVNHRTGNTVEVSPELAKLIRTGLDYYQISGGKFDITVAPLSDLWNFKSSSPVIPSDEEIANALKKVDAETLSLNGTTLTFASDDTMIDLGALVKGYAADQMKAYLMENGVSSGILNLGGNVITIGSKPDGNDWKIGITKPFDRENPVLDSVSVKDKTVVTSGIYERYFEQDGVIYHHVLDPDTGYPIQNGLWGVSIITDSSLKADALSTTCLAIGYEKARELIASLDDVQAEFVLEGNKIEKEP